MWVSYGLPYFHFFLNFSSFKDENLVTRGTWRERLQAWKEVLLKDKLAEQLESLKAQYVVEFDMKEVENSLRKDVIEKAKSTHGNRALWISKRWWRYRPKLPYTYFLQKLDSSEVHGSSVLAYVSSCFWGNNLLSREQILEFIYMAASVYMQKILFYYQFNI